MKKTGNILLILLLSFIISIGISAADVKLDAQLNRNRVSPEDTAILKIKVTGSDGAVTPLKPPKVKNMQIMYMNTARAMEWINGKYWSGPVLQYRIIPMKEGNYTIPPLSVKVNGEIYKTQPIKLVSDARYSARRGSLLDQFFNQDMPSEERDEIKIAAEIDIEKTNYYVGEPIVVKYFILTNYPDHIIPRALEIKNKESFYIKEYEENITIETVKTEQGEFSKVYVATRIFIPMEAKSFQIGNAELIFDMKSVFGGNRKKIIYEGKKVNIVKLPSKKNDVAGVGQFKISTDKNSFRSENGEIKFNIKLNGSGNVLNLGDPKIIKSNDLIIDFSLTDSNYTVDDFTVKGERTYTCSVISDDAGVFRIDDIVLTYFDPQTNRYETIQTDKINLNFIHNDENKNDEINDGSVSEKKSLLPFVVLISSILIFAAAGIFFLALYREKQKMQEQEDQAYTENKIIKRIKSQKENETEKINIDKNFIHNEMIRKLEEVFSRSEKYLHQNEIEKMFSYLKKENLIEKDSEIEKGVNFLKEKRYSGRSVSDEFLISLKNQLISALKK